MSPDSGVARTGIEVSVVDMGPDAQQADVHPSGDRREGEREGAAGLGRELVRDQLGALSSSERCDSCASRPQADGVDDRASMPDHEGEDHARRLSARSRSRGRDARKPADDDLARRRTTVLSLRTISIQAQTLSMYETAERGCCAGFSPTELSDARCRPTARRRPARSSCADSCRRCRCASAGQFRPQPERRT